ncbi:hypothetical protein KBI51_09685 [Aerococcaceae bacterium zg-ZUI334]|uniref:hypothetical protein n=1 Tax=Aerococcaceae bacterium zg-252 TaxID=2796928 RepID=UPI001B97B8AF|nr:hypothetical protein [Aerococcaceae bacterium zg-ZUI334]MBS4462865.1 hypothetical protein [Aerococcaceae bacterium zg-B36]
MNKYTITIRTTDGYIITRTVSSDNKYHAVLKFDKEIDNNLGLKRAAGDYAVLLVMEKK